MNYSVRRIHAANPLEHTRGVGARIRKNWSVGSELACVRLRTIGLSGKNRSESVSERFRR